LPKEIKIKEEDVREAITPSLNKIVDNIEGVLEETPPELIADIISEGIYLSGGTSLLRGLDKLIAGAVGLPVKIVEDPIMAVVRGIGVILEDLTGYKDLLININRENRQFKNEITTRTRKLLKGIIILN